MRLLAAMLVLCASAGMAAAAPVALMKRVRFPGCQPVFGTYPANGAKNVPRNAHAWVFGGTLGNYELVRGNKREPVRGTVHEQFHMIELALPHLDANTRYTIVYADRELASFTTGAADDVTPPDPPAYVSATVSYGPGTRVSLTSDAAGRQGVLKLTIQTEQRSTPLFLPASSLPQFGADCAGVPLRAGQVVCFDLAELDLAANRSAATRYCTTVREEQPQVCLVRPRDQKPSPGLRLAMFCVLGVVCGLGIRRLRTRAALVAYRRATHTPIAIEHVRTLAASDRSAAYLQLAAALAGLPLVYLLDAPSWLALAVVPVAFATTAVATARRMQRVLMDLDAQNASATYDGDTYLFTQPHHWIAINPRQLDHVIAASFPTAKIR